MTSTDATITMQPIPEPEPRPRGPRHALIYPPHWWTRAWYALLRRPIPTPAGRPPAGMDETYVDELKKINAAHAKETATMRADTEEFPAVNDIVPEEALVEQTLHLDLNVDVEPPLPRRRPGAALVATGEFTACRGCGQLGCTGDCPVLTAARRRERFLRAVADGVHTAHLDLGHPPHEQEQH